MTAINNNNNNNNDTEMGITKKPQTKKAEKGWERRTELGIGRQREGVNRLKWFRSSWVPL